MINQKLRIIGIDPGLSNTGYGILDVNFNDFKAIEGGVIRTKSSDSLEKRLNIIFENISQIIEEFSPVEMAI